MRMLHFHFARLVVIAAWNQRSCCRTMLSIQLFGVALSLLLVTDNVYAAPSPDTLALLAFQVTADPSLRVLNWTGGEACSVTGWNGVSCDKEGGRVRELVLEGMNLTGSMATLSNLTELRLLSLKDNKFNGSVPEMKQWRYLRHLYLHNNQLSGVLPESLASVTRLLRFTANNNQFMGPMPLALMKLTHLATLRLENNQLSGLIHAIQLPNLNDFNVSHNQMVGSIPMSLERFGASAFQGNPMLCGWPLFPSMVCNGTMPKTVPSMENTGPGMSSEKRRSGLSTGAIVAIALGDAVLFMLISILSVTYYWRKYPCHEKIPGKLDEMLVMTQQYAPTAKASESSKLVFFEHSIRFELGDLLRASAEMLGKGSFGTTYKAVLETGEVVAVKRMKEVNGCSKKDFEQKMEMVGKLWHPNVLPLRAYYDAKEEKLLVYDYEPNGSLYSCLHGRGPSRTTLDWATRLKIALGVAKALCYLHHECEKPKLSHGNIKSSNILLDENHHPLLADFGLALITNSSFAATTARVTGYRAPEHASSKRISQAVDVYSFGVVLLELLTGKAPASFHPCEKVMDLPKWVQSVVREEWTAEVFDIELLQHKYLEEDMVSLLQTALLCTEPIAERRPNLTAVVPLIENLSHDPSAPNSRTTSVSQSPSLSGNIVAPAPHFDS